MHLAGFDLSANVPRSQEIERILCPLEVLPEEMMLTSNLENSKSRSARRSKTMDNVVCHELILRLELLLSTSHESAGSLQGMRRTLGEAHLLIEAKSRALDR